MDSLSATLLPKKYLMCQVKYGVWQKDRQIVGFGLLTPAFPRNLIASRFKADVASSHWLWNTFVLNTTKDVIR